VTAALSPPLPAEPIEPWISLAWQLAMSAFAAGIAMALAFIVIVVLIEIYDEWIGAPRPPAWWRRPWCLAVGAHRHDRPGSALLSSTCVRCGAAADRDRDQEAAR